MNIDETLLGPVYGFVAQAAEDPSPEFMRGYELGRLTKHMETLAGCIELTVHSADLPAILDCAHRCGWAVEMSCLTRGFHQVTARKRVCRKFRVVAGRDHVAPT